MTENRTLLNLSNNPFDLFSLWFEEANAKEINDPNAMNLATISKDLKPSSRMVLLKSFDVNGFVFYTNIKSKKGISMIDNPYVSLNFHWKSLMKQVRIEGKICQVSDIEANNYFDTRHEESRIGAWASNQSRELKNRKILQDNIDYYKLKFKDNKIPRPNHWTGFRVDPNLIEFWQDMSFRLHDRLEFVKKNNSWKARKLFP
ncbi:pyridoxamine 5'-phosphate oxidase [Alphaproteobacteria bacterium]|nr:pyridoxamine 5'-phosphate oxidase [Alphaproteobacteria bacterium]